ncbi:hypothetical protein M5K25_016758 [Dendrobium thyrsiflorum]|uniref:Peptidase S9 prolyl oligopeptidase catalytic domain-containing protein n=1 Tax=Dendrobium thyrsiflorum TaxID=117978 RepID=A0ABD0UKH0_DENTH
MYGRLGMVDVVSQVFDSISERNVGSSTAIIYGLVQHDHAKEGLVLFCKMRLTVQGRWNQGYILKKGLSMNSFIGSALWDVYVKCGKRYSPLHNVIRPWEKSSDSSTQYPPTMLLTADHDDRVVPLHELKFLATMQYILCTSLENTPQKNPIIARIDRKDGHGVGRSTQKMIDEAADRYGFAAKMMGVSWND